MTNITIYGKAPVSRIMDVAPEVGQEWWAPGNFERVRITNVDLYMVYAEGIDKDIEIQGDIDSWVKQGTLIKPLKT